MIAKLIEAARTLDLATVARILSHPDFVLDRDPEVFMADLVANGEVDEHVFVYIDERINRRLPWSPDATLHQLLDDFVCVDTIDEYRALLKVRIERPLNHKEQYDLIRIAGAGAYKWDTYKSYRALYWLGKSGLITRDPITIICDGLGWNNKVLAERVSRLLKPDAKMLLPH